MSRPNFELGRCPGFIWALVTPLLWTSLLPSENTFIGKRTALHLAGMHYSFGNTALSSSR